MQSGSQNNTIQDSVMLWNDTNAGLSPTGGSSGNFVLGNIISRNGTPVFVDGTPAPATYTGNIENY